MQRLDISQFQKQMHQIELVLDEIEQGTSPLGQFIKGEAIYNDLRDKIAELQRGIHVAADTTTAVGQGALHGRVVPQGHRTPAPVGRQPGSPSGGAGKRRGSAARYPAV